MLLEKRCSSGSFQSTGLCTCASWKVACRCPSFWRRKGRQECLRPVVSAAEEGAAGLPPLSLRENFPENAELARQASKEEHRRRSSGKRDVQIEASQSPSLASQSNPKGRAGYEAGWLAVVRRPQVGTKAEEAATRNPFTQVSDKLIASASKSAGENTSCPHRGKLCACARTP